MTATAETTAITLVPRSKGRASLPTYQTIADFLEKKNGSGVRLAAWTVARTLLIAPPMMAVGVPAKKAFLGAGLASAMISVFTLLRIYNAEFEARQKQPPRAVAHLRPRVDDDE